MSLKIGIFTRPIDQGTSGSGFHLLEILNHLLDLDTENEYTLIHHGKNDNPIYSRCRELIVPRNPFAAAPRIRAEGFDIVHYNPLTILSPIWFIGAKRVTTLHGASILFLPNQFSLVKRVHARFALPILARRMDGIVTVSRESSAFFVERYGVEPEMIQVCPNAVKDDYHPAPSLGDRKTGVPERPRILHISKFSERKNPWTLLEAFKKTAAEIPGAQLVLVGSGWRNPAVTAWLAERELSDSVEFRGFISEREKIGLLQTADLFVFPSLYEGFGMPNLEAMACGCPVVTSSVFAIPEVVGDAALMVKDPRDPTELSGKMLAVLHDSALRAGMIERGLQRVKEFSWRRSALDLKIFYERIAAV